MAYSDILMTTPILARYVLYYLMVVDIWRCEKYLGKNRSAYLPLAYLNRSRAMVLLRSRSDAPGAGRAAPDRQVTVVCVAMRESARHGSVHHRTFPRFEE